jgi:hypothetical protein
LLTRKMDFIRALQPFFNAREVVFAKPLPDLQAQFLSFPSGRIDAPNALAYALKMRPGAPLYDDFSARHVAEELGVSEGAPAWLCCNAGTGLVTAILAQLLDGSIRIAADWVREGDAGTVLADIIQEANLEAGRTVRLISSPSHFDRFNNFGLVQAAKAIPMDMRRGATPDAGRTQIRNLLKRERRGMPMLMVSTDARWTLNGFAGGYARVLLKGGLLADYAEEGQYRVLMEGLECFAGLLASGAAGEDDEPRNWAYTHDGRKYVTARGTG